MPPLTRQRTVESIFSWWSDSNPNVGPTNPIHAVAKPLMRPMYHRAASAFIVKHRSDPLSKETMEICSSYLGSKYVSSSTKIVILSELCQRTRDADDSRTMIDSPLFDLSEKLLGSPDTDVRILMWELLTRLDHNNTFAMAQLVALLRGTKLDVVASALHALYRIASSPEGAKAAVDADVLECLANLLQSPRLEVQEGTRQLLAQLAWHKPIVAANMLDRMGNLLASSNKEVRDWTWKVVLGSS
ncbi:armadillo-type protein [Mycena latifolia]|nr:armadillo-type protein [Mycena latifolia]